MEKKKDLGFYDMGTEVYIRENLKMIKGMEKVFIISQVGTSSKDNSGKMKEMGMEYIIMKAVVPMKDSIKMGIRME